MNSKILLVAARELRFRFTSKISIISTLILLVLTVGSPWVLYLSHHATKPTISIGTVNLASGVQTKFSTALSAVYYGQQVDLRYVAFTSSKEGIRDFQKTKISALVSYKDARFTFIFKKPIDRNVQSNLLSASQQFQQAAYSNLHYLDLQRYSLYMNSHQAKIINVEASDNSDLLIGLFLLVFLYTLVSIAGASLAMGVVEEKSSKVMELIVSAIRPKALLKGKILGIVTFTIIEFIFLMAAGYLSGKIAGTINLHQLSFSVIAKMLLWLIPALLFFSFIYAGLGSSVARMEDIGLVQTPLGLLLMGCLYLGVFTVLYPTAWWAHLASYLPPFDFFVEPMRMLSGSSSTFEFWVTYSISLFATLVSVIVSLSIFEFSVLQSSDHRLMRGFIQSRKGRKLARKVY